MPSVASTEDTPQLFWPLPGRTVDRLAEYQGLLRELLSLIGGGGPATWTRDVEARPGWHHRARRAVGAAVKQRAKDESDSDAVPEVWFEPLVRAAVYEPDPSFNRQLVEPAVAAFGRRRVQLALLAYLDSGSAPDAAGAARAWYWTQVPLRYVGGSSTPTQESAAEYEAFSDLRRRYRYIALRRFVTEQDLDVRRCILPGLTLDPLVYPAEMHDLVTQAVQIARTSDDEYLRHRVEIQVGSGP
jgi:hypothetical protein